MPLRGIMISDGIAGVGLCSILGFVFYFLLTVFCLHKFKKNISIKLVIGAILLGLCLLQLPLRIISFQNTLISLPDFLLHLLGVILGCIGYLVGKRTKWVLFLGGLLFCLFMLFCGYDLFHHKLAFGTFTGQTEMVLSPDIKFADNQEHEISLKEIKGKYVIMDFWYSGCGVCFSEMPKVQALYDGLSEHDDVSLYSINARLETEPDTLAFTRLKELGFSLPTLRIDIDHPALALLGVDRYPTVLIFDSNRNLIFRGNIEMARKKINGLINNK